MVLNACYSEIQAIAIAKCIPYVVGMKKAIGDAAAIEFAVAFYDGLGAGDSVEFAYKLACNAIQWAGIPENCIPVLLKRDLKSEKTQKAPQGNTNQKRNLRTYFMIGCGLGNSIGLAPIPSGQEIDTTALDDFIGNLQEIGIGNGKTTLSIIEARDRMQAASTLQNEEIKTILENFFTAIRRLSDEVRANSSSDEYQWVKLGNLLYETALLAAMNKSAVASALALESLLENMQLPSNLQPEFAEFIQLAKSGNKKNRNLVYLKANQIAQVVYSLL